MEHRNELGLFWFWPLIWAATALSPAAAVVVWSSRAKKAIDQHKQARSKAKTYAMYAGAAIAGVWLYRSRR